MTNTSHKRILHERDMALLAQDRRGQSKHEAKAALREAARREGTPRRQVRGLFADNTFRTYIDHSNTFINYVNSLGVDVKHLADCRMFVKPYFDDMARRNLSAWTIQTRMHALAAIFQCDAADFDVTLPERRRKNIKRTRVQSKTDESFKSEKYGQIRLFIAATGARRGGFKRLTKTDLTEKPGGDLLIHLDEKGGKERDALVLPEFTEFVEQTVHDSPGYGPNQYVFPKNYIPRSLTVHCYRALYAQKLYDVLKDRNLGDGTLYHCRKDMKGKAFDRNLLLLVSRNMGHNRLDVVVNSYFYPVSRTNMPQALQEKAGG